MKRSLAVVAVLAALPAIVLAGWTELPSMPLAPSAEPVKGGGWLAFDTANGLVYAAKGNKTSDFYSYDPATTSWTELAPIPLGTEQKLPQNGCRGIWDGGDFIYMTKGRNTQGFWRYDIAGNAWTQLADVPLGLSGKRVKGGTDMECVGGWVYLLKGYKTDFMRYDPGTNSWEELASAPRGKRPKWDKGSWLKKNGAGTVLYAHKAKHHELWTYDPATGAWATEELAGMPRESQTGKKKKSKQGGSAAYYEGAFYALKGGNTCELWKYDLTAMDWTELEPAPLYNAAGEKKTIKHGGHIVLGGEGLFYVLKGKKSTQFWQYAVTPLDGTEPGDAGVMAGGTAARGVTISPNPAAGPVRLEADLSAAARVRVFDTGGRLVSERTMNPHSSLTLPALATGVYLVRVTSPEHASAHKLVVR